jgi:hypothetical protein
VKLSQWAEQFEETQRLYREAEEVTAESVTATREALPKSECLSLAWTALRFALLEREIVAHARMLSSEHWASSNMVEDMRSARVALTCLQARAELHDGDAKAAAVHAREAADLLAECGPGARSAKAAVEVMALCAIIAREIEASVAMEGELDGWEAEPEYDPPIIIHDDGPEPEPEDDGMGVAE